MAAHASRNGGPSNPRREHARRLVALAYIVAVAMPPIGFGLGIAIAAGFRTLRSKHGVWIIVVSILASLIWILIVTSGALKSTTTGY